MRVPQRRSQEVDPVHADEIPVTGSSIEDIDIPYFDSFFEKEFGEPVESQRLSRALLLENMHLASHGRLNICGTLLFASKPYVRLPVFIVKAVAFPGLDLEDERYDDSRDIKGKMSDVFDQTVRFLLWNIRHVQNNQGFNSLGEPEIPRVVFQELVANALIHRDYGVPAPIRVLIFNSRIEIISPGRLPDNLTIENIKMGHSNARNPVLASFAAKILPCRGLGSGIRRALKHYPDIDFIDDKIGNLFKVVIKRKVLTR